MDRHATLVIHVDDRLQPLGGGWQQLDDDGDLRQLVAMPAGPFQTTQEFLADLLVDIELHGIQLRMPF